MATTGVSQLFVDTNILIYATDPVSPLNGTAIGTLQHARATSIDLMISPQILREYLAAATRVAITGSGSPIASIMQNFRVFRTDFTVLADSPVVLDHLDNLVSSIPVAGKQIHDANIVPTMQAYGVRHLLTHNTGDFTRFAHLITVVPLGTAP